MPLRISVALGGLFTSNNADEFVNPDILDSRKTAVVNSIVVEESNSGSMMFG